MFADIYGRRRVCILVAFMLCFVLTASEVLQTNIFGFSAFAKYIVYAVTQFIVGALAKTLYCVSYILLIEFTTSKHSTRTTNIFLYSYVFGELLLLTLAYFLRNWHTLNAIMAAYSFGVVCILAFILPESPRFLLNKKRNSEAAKVLASIAKINGKESELTRAEFFETKLVEIDAESAAKPGSEDNETEKQSAKFILSQIVTPLATLAKTLMFIYIWTSLNLVYFGMSLGK